MSLLSAHQPLSAATTTTAMSDSDQSTTTTTTADDLLLQISADFSAATRHYGTDVGGLHWVDSLQMHVAFFVLNDATDQHRKARNRLPAGPQV